MNTLIQFDPTTIPPRRPFVFASRASLTSLASLAPLAAVLLLAWGLLLGSVALADEGDDPSGAPASEDIDLRDPAESARVRFLEGDLKIERYDNDQVDLATLNAPVFAGDIVTSAHGRGEVQLASGTLVRLDENTRVTFLSLPGGDGDVDTVLQVSEGSANIEVHGALSRRKDFRVDTPSASVYLLASGRYRVDVEGRYQKTRASAFRGVAEVVGDDGSVILRSGQRTNVGDTGEPEAPRSFNTAASDAFDGWVLDRNAHYRVASAGPDSGARPGESANPESDSGSYEGDEGYQPEAESIPEQVRPYTSELSYYGSWANVAPYGSVWIPGGVSAGWRPYYNGYWSYGPGGNFWVSYDPWGWAPYHYGRWAFAGGRWCWVPGGVFAPAWVSWYYGPSYFGWCPLDYWNYPCALRYGYVGYDFHCWNFVGYHNVYHHNVRRVYAPPASVRVELNKGVVVHGRPVPLRPSDIRLNKIAPPQILQKARDMKLSRIDVNAERVSKRSFRDGEKEQIARRAAGLRRMSPGDGKAGKQDGKPSAAGRGDSAKGGSREGRDKGSKSGSPGRSGGKARPVQPQGPRPHGPDRPSDNDKNRGHGSGGSHKASPRVYTNEDLVPSRPRVTSGNDPSRPPGGSGFAQRGPDPSRSRGSSAYEERQMQPSRPRGSSEPRPPGVGANRGERPDRRLMNVFREPARAPSRAQGAPRSAPQFRPSQSARPSGGRSQPRASRPSLVQHPQNSDKKKR